MCNQQHPQDMHTHTQLNNLVVKCQDRDGDKSWMVEQGTLDEEVEKQ